MASCKLTIEDEVNIKLEGLDVDVRRKLSNALKFEVPYARYMPQYKLGRWDGKVAFFGIGGTGYVNHLDVITSVLEKNRVQIVDIEDRRHPIQLDFQTSNRTLLGRPRCMLAQRTSCRRRRNHSA